jgi:hypothetical protein
MPPRLTAVNLRNDRRLARLGRRSVGWRSPVILFCNCSSSSSQLCYKQPFEMRLRSRRSLPFVLMFSSAASPLGDANGTSLPSAAILAQSLRPDAPRPAEPPATLPILRNGVRATEISVDEIKDRRRGRLTRYGQEFDYVPFVEILQLAGIDARARLRVVGEDESLILQAGSPSDVDPAGYAVIVNTRGFLVLTPVPGFRRSDGPGAVSPQPGSGRASQPPPSDAQRPHQPGSGAPPESSGALPPPGSGMGRASGAGNPPSSTRPSGSGAAADAPRHQSGTNQRATLGELKEVRRVSRIEIVR